MQQIFKTNTKATYFEGTFKLRDNNTTNWATPIDFPTVFTAYGKGIKSGGWQSCTSINTPKYVIEHFFNNRIGSLKVFLDCVFNLENIAWEDVAKDKENVLKLINLANNELLKLKQL
jgi:hypothetical protein